MNELYRFFQDLIGFIVERLELLGDGWALALISSVVGAILVLLYKVVSAQESIAQTKRAIFANILESVLFRRDTKVSLMAQFRAFLLGLKYAALAVPALVILAVPALLILGSLFPYFAIGALNLGEPVVVTAKLQDPSDVDAVHLELLGEGHVVGPVRQIEDGTVSWRVTAGKKPRPIDELYGAKSTPADSASIKIKIGDAEELIPLKLSPSEKALSYLPISFAWLTGAELVPASLRSQLEELDIAYAPRSVHWLGFDWNWLLLFFVVSLVAGLGISKVAGVEI